MQLLCPQAPLPARCPAAFRRSAAFRSVVAPASTRSASAQLRERARLLALPTGPPVLDAPSLLARCPPSLCLLCSLHLSHVLSSPPLTFELSRFHFWIFNAYPSRCLSAQLRCSRTQILFSKIKVSFQAHRLHHSLNLYKTCSGGFEVL